MTSEITLFVNPTAGRGRGAHAAQPAASALRAAGFSVRTVLGENADDALTRARAAVEAGTGALVAVGGDGMANLALQAVAGTRTPLGVVAVGTGNDFARALGLPVRDPAAAGRLVAEALKGARLRDIDLGRVGGTWFGTVLASGFDSRVNDRGNRMRWPAGRFKYDLAMLAELAAFKPIPYRITLDDGAVREIEATLVAVGNGSSYGGGMKICAGADIDGRALRRHGRRGLQPDDAAQGLPAGLQGDASRPPRGHRAPRGEGRAGCRGDHRIRRRGAARTAAADRGVRARRGAGRGALSSGTRPWGFPSWSDAGPTAPIG